MSFESGSITYRRFRVIGNNQPPLPDVELLARLQEHAVTPADLGTPEPCEWGWTGGRHIDDGSFTFQHNVFNDCVFFALRIDTNKVPGAKKKAITLDIEDAIAKGNPSGFLSKKQRHDATLEVSQRLEDELKSGRSRTTKLLPILWDLPNQVLYCHCSQNAQEKLVEIFSRTFNLDLEPGSAGVLARTILEPLGKRRDYEDLKPTRFVHGPGGESQWPDYPWVSKGPEPKDFLGNEFLLWLWYHADARNGVIPTRRLAPSLSGVLLSPSSDVTVMFDKSLDLDCAYGESGRDVLRGTGPTRMPEALKALQAGKLPRKAGLILDSAGSQYTLTLQADRWEIAGLQLPEIEDADTPRTLFEERITQLREFNQVLHELFATFLQERNQSTNAQIRTWIQNVARG